MSKLGGSGYDMTASEVIAEDARLRALENAATKPVNPKDAAGSAKYPMITVSQAVMAEVGCAMLEGALKYGRHNYRKAGIEAGVNMAAVLRHIQAFWEGQDLDPDTAAVDPKTGNTVAIHHVTKAIAALTVLRDGMLMGNWTDDRPPILPDGWIENCNAITRALLAKYPNPVQPFTHAGSFQKFIDYTVDLVKGGSYDPFATEVKSYNTPKAPDPQKLEAACDAAGEAAMDPRRQTVERSMATKVSKPIWRYFGGREYQAAEERLAITDRRVCTIGLRYDQGGKRLQIRRACDRK